MRSAHLPNNSATVSGHERVLGLRVSVSPDGDGATFTVELSSMPPFNVYVPFGEIGGVLNEVRFAAAEMAAKQRLKLNRGAEALEDLCDAALRPSLIHITTDPVTHDRLLLMQFDRSPPLTLRISPLHLPALLTELSKAFASAMN